MAGIGLACLTGCATLTSSGSPPITVTSTPAGARIYVEGELQPNLTPTDLSLRARPTQAIRVSWAGRDTTVVVHRRVNPRAFLDLINVGVLLDLAGVRVHPALRTAGYLSTPVALGIDVASGAFWQQQPRHLVINYPAAPEPPRPERRDSILQAYFARLAKATERCPEFVREIILSTDPEAVPEAANFSFDPATDSLIDAHVARMALLLQRRCSAPTPLVRAIVAEGADPLNVPAESIAVNSIAAPVFFDFDSTSLPDSVRPRLRQLSSWLMSEEYTAHIEVVLRGFADPAGTESVNMRFASARARSVRDELVRVGLPADCCRIEAIGENPLYLAERDAMGRRNPDARYNRRVEILFRPRLGR